MDSVDLTIGLPIWYSAKISEVEDCMDSIYSALEKTKFAKINIMVGIDNIPPNFQPTEKKQNNIKEINDRINTFRSAILALSKKYTFEYFITEKNVKVSVMRNIMISKAQNSKYILFIDHDDKMLPNAFTIIFNVLDEAYKNGKVAIYFQSTINNEVKKFEGLAPWGVLYSPKFLLKNKIAFIPGIPLEDRYFRREIELYALEEEQLNVLESIYLHVREQASGWLSENMTDIVRQELYKRCCYTGIKPKNHLSLKRGLNEIFYQDIALKPEKYNIINEPNEAFFNLANKNKHITKDELETYRFYDNKGLFSYPMENHFTLCKVKNDANSTEIFCRGLITNKALNIDESNFDEFNLNVEKAGINSHTMFNNNENNIFNLTFEAVIKEDIETIQQNIEQYPEILSLTDDRGITLANIACRRQTIQDYFLLNAKSFFLDDKNKIIALLLKKSPSSFLTIDKYGQSGFKILLIDYLDNLKTKNKIDSNTINIFTEKILKLLNAVGELDYKLIPILKIIYMGKVNQQIDEFLSKNNHDSQETENFINSLYDVLIEYLNKELVRDNLLEAMKNKDYEKIEDIIITRKMPLDQLLGSQKQPGDIEVVYCKYTKFKILIESIEDILLNSINNDKKLKEIFRKFLIETIFLSLYNKTDKEILSLTFIERIKKAFELLFDEKYKFNYTEFKFNLFADTYCERSKILKAAKSFVEMANKFKTTNDSMNKNELEKIEQINTKFSKGINEGNELILSIEQMKNSNKPDSIRVFEFMDLLENFAKKKADELSNSSNT